MAVKTLAVGKVLWAKVLIGNSDPKITGRFYLEHLFKPRMIVRRIRLDKGTETGVMATMHAFVRWQHGEMDPLETVIYGPSTSSQVKNRYFIVGSFYKY